ncbi:MAG TPA: ABC transporter permease [Gemmata sp.]|nr:ABC transporter permease [Gemmata sp.]
MPKRTRGGSVGDRMSRFNLTLALDAKDWRLFWADRRAAVLCFLVPIALASAFGMIFNRPTAGSASRLPVLVVAEDRGPFTDRVIAELLASSRLEARLATRSEAEAAVKERSPSVAIILPPGFEQLRDWQPGGAGSGPELRILHHPAAGAERQWAEGAVTEVVMKELARAKFGSTKDGAAAFSAPFRVASASVSAGSPRFNSYSHSFCGMTLQYLLFWGMESGLVFLRERKSGVWVRTRATPVPFVCVVAGKVLSTAFIALLLVSATFAFGYVAFGVSVTGSFIGFLLLALAACALAAATGLLVAAIGGTEARARSVSILVILGVSMIGGL